MKAVVFRGIGDIRLEDVKEPKLEKPTDAIVRITASAICGTDLHMVRGTLPGMVPGTVLGHEGIGIVEEVGPDVRNLLKGDRVVIPATIACGSCVYCRAGYFSQCDESNPRGPDSGPAFFGGPASTGPFHGMQAERVRVPFANVGLVKLPEEMSDDDAILLSDIFPTAWFAAKLARVKKGSTVAVFGCGPVGQLSIASALLQGAGRVLAVDHVPSRLEKAAHQGAEVINFDVEHPVETIKRLTFGIGVDRAIDAVGVDAEHAMAGPAFKDTKTHRKAHEREMSEVAPRINPDGKNWHPGTAPSQAMEWAVDAMAKAGTLAIVGVYSPGSTHFPVGKAMEKNLSINMGNCNHRKYIPELIGLVRAGGFRPSKIVSNRMSLDSAIDAYKAFDRRDAGWLKVELKPAA